MRQLVQALAAGDEAALAELYEATSRRVYGLALRIVRDRATAEEVVHEVYAQAWRQADRYDAAKGSVPTWLLALARSRAIDLVRARDRQNARQEALEEGFDLKDPAPSPEENSLEQERAQHVRAALKTLPREQRRALEAAFFGGLSHVEVAHALGAPLGTVKTRIRAGLDAVRRALNPAKDLT